MDILKDKQYKQYNYLSRYSNFPYYYNTEDKKYMYGTTTQLNGETMYIIHKVKRGDTIDSIALNYFNNPTFYWLITDFNQIQNPFIKLEEGMELKIPTLSEISFKDNI